jgi:succinoglycan biosynthesis protein ExoV
VLLYYHQDPLRNFGDDLNPWLWERLLPGQFSGTVAHDPRARGDVSDGEVLFVGIGTLINTRVPAGPRKVVFGSGAGYGDVPKLDDKWDIHCVRGPMTARMLGLDASTAVTDPAVLVRTLDLGAVKRFANVAYMPHCASARAADWRAISEGAGLTLIDPQWPVERVLGAIRGTGMLVTEALHGAVVADAFRIPWLPVASTPALLDVKWHDWCQSVGLAYRPARVPTVWRAAETDSPWARIRSAANAARARHALRRIARAARPLLSKDERLFSVTEQLQERLARFRRLYGPAASAGAAGGLAMDAHPARD